MAIAWPIINIQESTPVSFRFVIHATTSPVLILNISGSELLNKMLKINPERNATIIRKRLIANSDMSLQQKILHMRHLDPIEENVANVSAVGLSGVGRIAMKPKVFLIIIRRISVVILNATFALRDGFPLGI